MQSITSIFHCKQSWHNANGQTSFVLAEQHPHRQTMMLCMQLRLHAQHQAFFYCYTGHVFSGIVLILNKQNKDQETQTQSIIINLSRLFQVCFQQIYICFFTIMPSSAGHTEAMPQNNYDIKNYSVLFILRVFLILKMMLRMQHKLHAPDPLPLPRCKWSFGFLNKI